jgi:acyl carrier protein
MEEKIRAILAGILEVDPARIDGGFGPDGCRDWDSLSNLRIITALEKEFTVSFTWPEISAMTDFSHICEVILRRRGSGKEAG